jgi:hypothetical protein
MYWDQHSFLVTFLQSPLLPILLAWEIVWKSIAMWKAARHNQLYWFIATVIFNTVGILPIVYILFFQKDRKEKK